jgi:5'-deoxynucleotidase YfbR-like HD superfamily hydrolase
VSRWALVHDLPEVVTGDIATPTKRAMREAVPDDDPIKRIELDLDIDYRLLYTQIRNSYPMALDIVKLADLMEAIHFLDIEGMGAHAAGVKAGLESALDTKILEMSHLYPELRVEFVHDLMYEMRNPVLITKTIYPVTKC